MLYGNGKVSRRIVVLVLDLSSDLRVGMGVRGELLRPILLVNTSQRRRDKTMARQVDHVHHRGITGDQQEKGELYNIQSIEVAWNHLFSLASHFIVSNERNLLSD